MKLILVFLLITPTIFSQNNDRNAMFNNQLFDSLIIGDWQLAKVEIVDGYNVISDTNRFESQASRIKKITITSDSIYNHRDTTLRYYIRNRNYSYKIKYDSIMRSNYLKLYSGKGRKLHEEDSYEIIACSIDEFVIKSYQFLNNGLDYTSISIVYTFRKNEISDLFERIKGNWFYCSNQINSFMTDNDSLTYEFMRAPIDSVCRKSENHVDLEFKRVDYKNKVEISEYDKHSCIIQETQFSISPINNLMYIIGFNKSFVYNFELVNNEKLILSLNAERTQKINMHNMR